MADLSKIDSYQYPAAHLGHLSDDQQSALDKFKILCEEQGYYKSEGKEGETYASHDDETLLRYLRARRFNPTDALTQFKSTEDWRKENHLEELYNTIDTKEYDETRRLYPQWTGRRDKRGIPVYVFEVAHLNSKTISAYEKSVSKAPTVAHDSKKVPTKMLRLFALYENLTRFVLPLCTAIKDRPHPETPVSQSNNIVDISGVGLKQFWNLKAHMQDASTLATAYYPETLDRIFIIGAPSFFPTVWSWIKRWFDPITVSKIFILSSSDMKPTLEKYIDIENIPKKYGGTLDFEFGMMPMLEESISSSLKWTDPSADLQNGQKSIPTGPIKWSQGNSGEMQAIAVGSESGKSRERTIASIETVFQGMHGISRQNTKINWATEKVQPTDGIATQPKVEGDPDFGSDLTSGTATPQPGDGTSTPQPINSGDTVIGVVKANNTTTLPARPINDGENDLLPSDTQPRTGTSDTRFEQQDATHAAGQLASGTPHTIHYGQGDKAVTYEPSTVGQAAKDVTANLPSPEEPAAPSYLAQAQSLASQAYSSTTGAASAAAGAMASSVGVGKTTEAISEAAQGEAKGKGDETVAGIKDEGVEEFLRSQYPSTHASKEGGS